MEIANSIILLLLISAGIGDGAQNASGRAHEVHVGVILDLGSLVGKIAITSISLGLEDFYSAHQNYSTKLVLHIRDSMSDDVRAAAEGRCSKTLRCAHCINLLLCSCWMKSCTHSCSIVHNPFILKHKSIQIHSAQLSGHGRAHMQRSTTVR